MEKWHHKGINLESLLTPGRKSDIILTGNSVHLKTSNKRRAGFESV
jgi:hypothetical protein